MHTIHLTREITSVVSFLFYLFTGELKGIGAYMHDENCKNENCKNLMASLSNAEKIIDVQHDYAQKLYKLFFFVVTAFVLLVLLRDYIQYNSTYEPPNTANQTNIIKKKGE